MAEWTPERRAAAQRMQREGKSFLDIATTLGGFDGYFDRGRSAVAGFLRRLALPPAPKKPRGPRPGRRRGGRQPDPRGVLAAAIVLDAYEEAMEETGLTREQVLSALRLSRRRETWQRRRLLAESQNA